MQFAAANKIRLTKTGWDPDGDGTYVRTAASSHLYSAHMEPARHECHYTLLLGGTEARARDAAASANARFVRPRLAPAARLAPRVPSRCARATAGDRVAVV